MNRTSLCCALVAFGILGLSASATANDHDKDFRHHEVREHREHEHAREAREHDRRAFEHREHERREHERQEWARHHQHDNGKHLGWEKGKHNPHHNAAFHPAPGAHPHHPEHARGPRPHPEPAQGK